VGGSLPLAPGVSTVRYPIPERIFDYVSTVRSATARNVPEADPLPSCREVLGQLLTISEGSRSSNGSRPEISEARRLRAKQGVALANLGRTALLQERRPLCLSDRGAGWCRIIRHRGGAMEPGEPSRVERRLAAVRGGRGGLFVSDRRRRGGYARAPQGRIPARRCSRKQRTAASGYIRIACT
jgi:hypothetical protein